MPDVQEREETDNAAGSSFVPDESTPSFDEKFKVKEECFDDEGYIRDWAKKNLSEFRHLGLVLCQWVD